MKYIILMLVFMGSAQAWDGEIAVGHTTFGKQENGIWYQNPFPSDLQMSSSSIALGITGEIDSWLKYHIGYKYLGSVHSYALAVSGDDIYAKYGAQANQHEKYATWIGSGTVNMLYATIAPTYKVGNWTFGTEVGLTVYNPTWSEEVIGWQATPTTAPINLTVKHIPKIETGGTIGLSVGYKNTELVLNAYDMRTEDKLYPALYHGLATSLSIRHTF